MALSWSLGIATITSMPEPARATMVFVSASKSFTFCTLLSFNICTTVFGGSWWVAIVPQFTPKAETLLEKKDKEEMVMQRKMTVVVLGFQ